MTNSAEMPNSREAEEALLGSVLIHPEIYLLLDIEPRDFFRPCNREIWQVFGELDQIDYVSVVERLRAKKKLDSVGGPAYITGLANACVSSMHAEEYAKTVRDYSRRRGLILLANEIIKTSFDTGKDIQAQTPSFINSIVDASRINDGAISIREIMSQLYDETSERARNPRDIWGLKTGFPKFDILTGGLQKTELMLLAGEPGVGKSILAMQMGIQMGSEYPGAIYSMEMGKMQLARRLASGKSKIQTRSLKTGRMKDNDWADFTLAMEKLTGLPVFISDSSNWTTTSLRADLARLKAQHGIEWFVLDYMYLLNDGAGSDEIERTSLASKGLKQICKDLDLAGIAVHSLNKTGIGQDTMPTNQSIRGSGQVVYDADLIVYLTKFKPCDIIQESIPANEKENLRSLFFGKGRELEEPNKFIQLVKQPGYPLFGEMEKQ